MNENQSIFTVSNFKFSIFDSVPKPDSNKALILYKEGGNQEKILVITEQNPVLGSQVKAGGYNKIMEISLEEKRLELQTEIADDTNNFRFFVKVSLKYRVNDPVYIFKHRITSTEEKIRTIVSNAVGEEHRKYDIESQIELERDLKDKVFKRIQDILYIQITELSLNAILDERAQRIIDSNLDAMAMDVVERNANEKISREIAEKKKIEIQQLEAAKEIEQRKNALNMEKAEGMKALEEKLGEDYSTFLAYVNGEITSIEFDQQMHKNRNTAMVAKLQYFKQLVEMDVLSGPALERAATKLLGDDSGEEQSDQQVLIGENTAENVVVEDTEEY